MTWWRLIGCDTQTPGLNNGFSDTWRKKVSASENRSTGGLSDRFVP